MPTTITLDGVHGSSNPIKRFFQRVGLGRDDRGQWLGCPPGVGCLPPAGPHLGDAWSDEAAAGSSAGDNAVADFTVAAVGWGVLAFAVGTAAVRGWNASQRLFRR